MSKQPQAESRADAYAFPPMNGNSPETGGSAEGEMNRRGRREGDGAGPSAAPDAASQNAPEATGPGWEQPAGFAPSPVPGMQYGNAGEVPQGGQYGYAGGQEAPLGPQAQTPPPAAAPETGGCGCGGEAEAPQAPQAPMNGQAMYQYAGQAPYGFAQETPYGYAPGAPYAPGMVPPQGPAGPYGPAPGMPYGPPSFAQPAEPSQDHGQRHGACAGHSQQAGMFPGAGFAPGQPGMYPGGMPGQAGMYAGQAGPGAFNGMNDPFGFAARFAGADQGQFDRRFGQAMEIYGDFMQGKTDPNKIMNFLTSTGPNFWKGAVVGALLTFVLTNNSVKSTIGDAFSGLCGSGKASE